MIKEITVNRYNVSLLDEPTYTSESSDNIRSYDMELGGNKQYLSSSIHGLIVGNINHPISSVVLHGDGRATGIHEHSLASCNDICYVAVGYSVFAFQVPSLQLKWTKRVDHATCFGVYWLEDENCLITWGELEVSRYTATGEKVWSTSGADIFTEGFKILNGLIEVIDFNSDIYSINISSG